MMAWEFALERIKRKNIDQWRKIVTHSMTGRLQGIHEKAHDAPGLWMRSQFAQNPTYLELSNTFWEMRIHYARFLPLLAVGCVIFIFSSILVGVVLPLQEYQSSGFEGDFFFILILGLLGGGVASGTLVHKLIDSFCRGYYTSSNTQLRGRIRFNRKTRKIYVLRPENCGGNVILDWDRIHVNLRVAPFSFIRGVPVKWVIEKWKVPMLIYQPPDENGQGEECITVGPDADDAETIDGLYRYWEHIRIYMEKGVDDLSSINIPEWGWDHASTFAGKPSYDHCRYEMQAAGPEVSFQMWLQKSCYWPTFPKEWQSDSGVGEPEDDPFEAGAWMTFWVYRQMGKISKETWLKAQERGWVEKGGRL